MMLTNPRILLKALVFLLWAFTTAVALWQVVIIHDMLLKIPLFLVRNEASSTNLRYSIWLIDAGLYLILALGWLAFFIISSNYHVKHAGQPRSWRFLAWTVGFQLSVFILAFLVM